VTVSFAHKAEFRTLNEDLGNKDYCINLKTQDQNDGQMMQDIFASVVSAFHASSLLLCDLFHFATKENDSLVMGQRPGVSPIRSKKTRSKDRKRYVNVRLY
jgi:hypothetical protein